MYKKKSLSKLILLILEKTVDGYVRFDDLIHKPKYYAWGSGWDYPLNKSALSNAIRRLRENGLIDFVDDETLVIKLTDKGKEKAVLTKLLINEDKWDGKWRIVIFDIPEKRRVVRDLLRQKLKSWEFLPWQQSVWVTKKDCTKPLREFIKSIGIKDWVKVIETDNVD
ncbi:MAG: hypothetical protein HYW45_00225 [Candidatus Daviesbacteria bacterium]|nr:MAG: hypothetical protein HYW45_00225 [Candidatus Daviesbacteria bacterium]